MIESTRSSMSNAERAALETPYTIQSFHDLQRLTGLTSEELYLRFVHYSRAGIRIEDVIKLAKLGHYK